MGTPIATPENFVQDPHFDLAKGAPGNPWFYPLGWDNIGNVADFDEWAGGGGFWMLQTTIAATPNNYYTVEFNILSIKSSDVPHEGFRFLWTGYQTAYFHEPGHYAINFKATGPHTVLALDPPSDVGLSGKMRIDDVLLYEQNLTDYVATHLLTLPIEYTMTETWDLGGGRWMFLFANTITGFNTLLIYET